VLAWSCLEAMAVLLSPAIALGTQSLFRMGINLADAVDPAALRTFSPRKAATSALFLKGP
jgi:hypothetical protein